MKKYIVKIEIRLKEGILDAEGRTIERAIKRFGLNVENTRKGKIIEFVVHIDDDEENLESRLEKLIKNLLINPLTEDYVLEVKGEEA